MSQKLRIGILGCARIAKTALIDVAPLVPEIEVAGVASRDRRRGEAFAQAHGIPKVFGDYEALIADPGIQAIYNPLPNSLHAEWTIRALRAGKAVLCEKPLAANAAESRRMAEAAGATGQPLVEAFHYRYHPLGIFIAELMRSGRLGALRRIDAGLKIPGAMVPQDDIRFERTLAGGAMMDVGSYCVNALRLVSGEEPVVEEAVAEQIKPEIDGAMQARMRFPGGAVGTIQASLTAGELGAWLNVEGEAGRLSINNPFLPQMGHQVVLELDGDRTEQTFDRTPTYVFQAREFARVVLEQAQIRTTAEDAVANMEIIDEVYRAAGLGAR
jgi:predicted dehydrogenase